MSKQTLDEIRKKLQAQDTRGNGQKSSKSKDKTTYPFWDMESGTNTSIRFLPDANRDNVFFWAEKQMITLDFAGVKGGDSKTVTVQVPCIEMWDGPNTCPIQNELRPMWKDASLEETARKYWKKKTYIFQGFVQNSSLKEDELPENPIRKFNVNGQLFKVIKAALLDPDFENLPTDYVNGTDFIITKTTQGKYADYTTSKYARRESALTAEQLEAIDKYGLADLSSYFPERPTANHMTAMFEMFEASLAGEAYDAERWGEYYRPYGVKTANAPVDTSAAKPKQVTEATVTSTKFKDAVEDDHNDDVPFATTQAEPSVSSSGAPKRSAADIIAALKNKSAQQ